MIYLITGVPGSGKSLYAVSKLLRDLLKETIKREDGSEISRRLCVDGIPDLLLPHELMAPLPDAGSFITNDKRQDAGEGADGDGLWNWWEWCKPGDVIVVDEVQRHWRPRGMGTKVPEQIARLETHRHYGVDFVLITQNPMLVDQNVRRLVGRHMHVRRLFGGARALIYDWDGCQSDTARLAGASRTLFSYPKDAYKLYRSSELHTKQRQKIPVWFAFPLVVVALAAVAGPKAYDAMHRSMSGKALSHEAVAVSSAAPAPGQRQGPATSSGTAASAAVPAKPVASAAQHLSGCISYKGRCECFGSDGARVDGMHPEDCQDASQRVSALPLEVSHAPAAEKVAKGPEQDCSWVVPMGNYPAEVRCWPKGERFGAVVPVSSMPPSQGTDGAPMGPSGVVGATPNGGAPNGGRGLAGVSGS